MPWSRVFNFNDPFPYQSTIRSGNWEVYPTKRGQFHAKLTQITLNQLWMQRFHQKVPQIQTGTVTPDRTIVGFLSEYPQPALHHRGEQITRRDLVVNIGVMHQRTEGECRFGGMSLANEDFDAACQAITGREFVLPPSKHVIRPNPDLMLRLQKLHEAVAGIAENNPRLLEQAEVARALEQQLVHLMVRCVTEGSALKMADGVRRHDGIVTRLEELLEANPDTPLYLSEICTALRTAERTLRIACEEHLGMGPIRYLALRRMHLVRRALLKADHRSTTVTRVATDHGFWELGRFAVAYRRLFGEPPLASLRRPSQDALSAVYRPLALEAIA